MSRRPTLASVSPIQLRRAEVALAEVDRARARLAEVAAAGAPYLQRRAAHAAVSAAFADADRVLREVTRAARPGPYHVWREWRHRLSQLDLAKNMHLFAESDAQVLGIGSVRAVDTGMLGPVNGDYLHGECSPHGTPARYGLDIDAALAARAALVATPAGRASGPPRSALAATPVTEPAVA